jgi:hypothetical protein
MALLARRNRQVTPKERGLALAFDHVLVVDVGVPVGLQRGPGLVLATRVRSVGVRHHLGVALLRRAVATGRVDLGVVAAVQAVVTGRVAAHIGRGTNPVAVDDAGHTAVDGVLGEENLSRRVRDLEKVVAILESSLRAAGLGASVEVHPELVLVDVTIDGFTIRRGGENGSGHWGSPIRGRIGGGHQSGNNNRGNAKNAH